MITKVGKCLNFCYKHTKLVRVQFSQIEWRPTESFIVEMVLVKIPAYE